MINLKGMHILFADDDLYNMRPTIDALEAKGARVDVVVNGTAVLEFLRNKQVPRPDLIILDIMMAEGEEISTSDEGRSTGLEVFKSIRNDLRLDIPIVVSTVVSDDEVLNFFEKEAHVAIINKPYLWADLFEKIGIVLL